MRGFENLKDPTHFVVMENQSDVMQAGKDGHNIREVLHENYSIPHQEGINENKFLKLLQGDKNTKSKDRRWMKLQTNSIVQQLVKEGYTTIDFPLGKLAAKTQGHRYTSPNEVAEYKHLNETNKEEIDELNTSKANLEKKQSKNYSKGSILVEKKQKLSSDIANQHLANEGYVLEDLYKRYKIHPQDSSYTKISDFRQYDAEINKIFNNAWRDLIAMGGHVEIGPLASKDFGKVNADKKLIEDYITTAKEYIDWEQNSKLFETQLLDMDSHLRKIGGIKPKLSSSQINYDGSHRKFLEKEFKHWLTETVDEFGYPILRLKVNPDLIEKVNNIKYQQGGELPKAQYGKFLSRLNKNLGTTLQNNVLKKFDINDFRNYSDDFYKNLINSSNEKLTQGLGIKKLPMNIKLEHPGKSGGLINVSMSDKNSPFVKTGELILAPVHSSHDFPNLHQRTATNILLNQKGPETFGIPKFKVDNNSYFFRNQSDLSESEKRLLDSYSRIPMLETHTTFDKNKFIDFGNRGLRKEWDAPFGSYDENHFYHGGNDILKGQGLSGEINEAINQSMKERGMSLFSGTTSHSTEGGDRYANLLQKGLVDPITNIPEINLHLDRLKKDPNTIENLSQYIVDNDVTFKYKKEGGEYLDLDLTEDQIKNFKDGGFVVKDLPKAQNGKIIKPIVNNFLRKYNINTSGFTNKINTETVSQLMKEASNFGLTAVPTSIGTYYLSQDGKKPYNLAKLYDDWRIKGSTKNLHELESFYLESMGKTHDKREMIEKFYKDSPITSIQGSELRLEDYKQLTDVGFHNANKLWKPEGLWYGIDNSWRDWVDGNMPEWKGQYKTPISLDLDYGHGIDKVIKLTRPELVQQFTNAFQKELIPGRSMMSGIDWNEVANRFGGVEISPFQPSNNMDWYDSWDVASGAIWNKRAIKGSQKIPGSDQIDQSRDEWDFKKGGELPKAQFGDLLPKFIKGITPKIPKAHQFNIGKDLRKFYNFEDDLLVALSKMGKDPGMPDFDINNYFSWAANLDKLPLSSSTMKEALEMSDFAKKDLTTRLKAFGHSTDDITKYLDKGLNLRLSKERFADKFNMLRKETDLPLSDWHFPNGTAPIAFQDHYRGDQLKSHMNKIGDPNKLSGWLKVKGDAGIQGAFSGKDFLWEKFLWDKFRNSEMEQFPRQGKFNDLIKDVPDDLFKKWQNKIKKSYDVLNASQKELMYKQRSTPFREAGYEPMNKQLMQTLSGEFIENKKGGSVNKFQDGGNNNKGFYYIDPKTKKRVWIENVRENSDRGYYDNKGYWHNQPLILSEFKNEEEFKVAEDEVAKKDKENKAAAEEAKKEANEKLENEKLENFKNNYPKKYKEYIANKKSLQKNTNPDKLNAKRTNETGTYKDKSVNIYEGSFDDSYNLARYHAGEKLLSGDPKDVFGWKNPNTGEIEYKHIYSAGETGEWSDGTPYVPGYSKEFLDAHPEFVEQVKEYRNFSDEELKKYNIDSEESQKKREEVETFMKDKPEFAQYFKNKKALKDNPDLFNDGEKHDITQQNEEVYQNAYKEHNSNVLSSETRKNVLNEAKNKSSNYPSQSGTPDITNPERFSYNDKVKVKDLYNGDGKYNSKYFSNEQLKNILHDEKNSYMAPEKIEELKKLEYIEQNHERQKFEMTTKQKDRLAVLRNEKMTLNKEYQPDGLTRNSIEEIDNEFSNLPLGNKLMFDYYKKNLLPEDYDNLVKGSIENIASYLEPEFKSTIENTAKERVENYKDAQDVGVMDYIDFAVSDPFRNLLGMNVSDTYRNKSLGERARAYKMANAMGNLDEVRGDTWGMATALNAGYWFGPTSRLPMANLAAQGLYDIGTEHIPNLYNEGTTNWGDLGRDAVSVALGRFRKGAKPLIKSLSNPNSVQRIMPRGKKFIPNLSPGKGEFYQPGQYIKPKDQSLFASGVSNTEGFYFRLPGNRSILTGRPPMNNYEHMYPTWGNKYFGGYKYGPASSSWKPTILDPNKNPGLGYEHGGEYKELNLTDPEIEKLKQQGYEIEYI